MKIVEVRSISSASLQTAHLSFLVVAGLILWWATLAAQAAQSVTLAWDASPDPTVAGYYVHYGTVSQAYTGRVDAGGATRATVSGLEIGQTYYFTVTAYSAQGFESAPSGEVAYTVPAPAAGQLRILPTSKPGTRPRLQFLVPPARQYEVQASVDLRSWKTIHAGVNLSTDWIEWTDPEAASFPTRFYRLVIPDKPQIPGVIRMVRNVRRLREVHLEVAVMPGRSYRIQASEDLTSWTTIRSGVSASSDPIEITDPDAGQFQERFYRLAFD